MNTYIKRKKSLSLSAFILICSMNTLFALTNHRNVDITSSASSNGGWTFASSTYTWTPSANNSVVNTTDIVACLLGSNTALGGDNALNSQTNGAASVTILTANAGGNQTGDLTISQGITAATTNATQMTFTITAAGSITVNNTVILTPASNAGAGYPGTNIVLTGPTGVNITQGITCIGGATTGAATTGGVGGNLTCTASGGTVTIGSTVTLTGGTGGSGGGAGAGGAGGAVTLSGQIISITQGVNSYGGAGSTSGAGGAGGTISITSTSTTVTIGNTIYTDGGAGATTGTGGAGGSITISAATTVSFTQPVHTSGGNSGTGNGGNGGAVSITSSSGALSIANTITTSGGNPGGGVNKNGGTGGAVTLTASTTLNVSQPVYANGGTPTGSGTATGGDVTLVGPSGITLSNIIQTTGTTAGGTITVNDGNTSITSGGGANDGQGGAAYFQAGALTKIGAGNFNLAHASNSWTGATTITAGKLTLGATSTVPDASQLVFNGGRLVMGAYSETVGTIKISAYSVLDLPASANYTLTCSASNGITWTAGKKLGINYWGDVGNNYDGTAAGGSDPKFKTGASAELDATHLAAIYFRRTSNGSSYTATQLASGEIVPTGTLPVELVSFNAKKNNDQVDITWETASEINSEYFEILRAKNDMQWESIGKVSAAGNSNKIIDYTSLDAFPAPGINYYKLVEYDFDGAHQESKVVSVNSDNVTETKLTAYPNPANTSTTFDFYSEKGGIYFLKAFTTNGEQIYSARIFGIPGENKFSLSMQDFSLGIYTFQLCNSDEKTLATTKVIKAN